MHHRQSQTPAPWKWDQVPPALMIGNGFNRTYHMKSWKNLVRTLRTDEAPDQAVMDSLPLTMQIVLASGDHVNESMEEVAEYMRSFQLTEPHIALLSRIREVPVRTILTTNYSYELEKVFSGDTGWWKENPYRRYAVPFRNRTSDRFLHRFSRVPLAGEEKEFRDIWHIHGEVDQPRQIIMGHYYYGKMEYEIQNYLPGMHRRYKYARAHDGLYSPRSWVDSFLMGDLYIAGFGLDLSEADIWYLACTKKRHFPHAGTYYYAPVGPDGRKSLPDAQKAMMETYGIEVRERPLLGEGEYRYARFYEEVLDEITACIREKQGQK